MSAPNITAHSQPYWTSTG